MYPEIPELYDAARSASHASGFPWTDPRSNVTYPPPPCDCGELSLIRRMEHISIDETDPIAHTAFFVLGCPVCRMARAFPESNLALVTPRARRALHLALAADGWWLPWLTP
jgi:hypothetical protein